MRRRCICVHEAGRRCVKERCVQHAAALLREGDAMRGRVEMLVKERCLRREGIRTHSWAVYWAGLLFTFAFFWFFFFPFSLFLSYSLLLFCHFLEW
jgi:hypothetical protein